MAMKVDDLRHELSSRGLPKEGLKRDLAFRLASSDDPYVFRPLRLPHTINLLPSVTSNKEVMLPRTPTYQRPNSKTKVPGNHRRYESNRLLPLIA